MIIGLDSKALKGYLQKWITCHDGCSMKNDERTGLV